MPVLSSSNSEIYCSKILVHCTVGWIHAVYTPSDSIVFGGNFLHSFNIAQQLMVSEVEQSTKVRVVFQESIYTQTLHNLLISINRIS